MQTGQERFSGEYGVCGYLVLMQADLTINPNGEDRTDGDDPPDNRFRLTGKPRATKNGNVAIGLELPGPGVVAGKAMAKLPTGALARTSKRTKVAVARGRLTARKSGKVKLVLRPGAAVRGFIDRQGKLRAKAKITYTPSGGTARSVKRPVTFK